MTELEQIKARLNAVIDEAQRRGDGGLIARAGELLARAGKLQSTLAALIEEVDALESLDSWDTRRGARTDSTSPALPHSLLLLPAIGPETARNLAKTVSRAVDASLLDAWCPREASVVRDRVRDRLAAWGFKDRGTRGQPPAVWDRIDVGTLALFGDRRSYFCRAWVIGKCRSEQGSEDLWGSPSFRWLIFLTSVGKTEVPIEEVRRVARYSPRFQMNRGALVPRPEVEPELWALLERHGALDGA